MPRGVPDDRILALDVLRGLTMAAMVVVNNPGDWDTVYAPLLHAEWHGWTPTDLIFPFFLFIVGVAMTLSRRTFGPARIVVRRSVTIYALGLAIGLFARPSIANLRFAGVLPRIAICYLVSALVVRAATRGGIDTSARARGVLLGVLALILLGYWALLTYVAWPGAVPGDLTPEGNLAAYVDRAWLPGRLYNKTWDPEGLLSTLPAIGTTLLGVVAGLRLLRDPSPSSREWHLIAAGLGATVVGWVWGQSFPINKNLWTSSYVLFTGGLATLLFAGVYWLVDVRGSRWWIRPFVVLGSNAIALFVLSDVVAIVLLKIPASLESGKTGTLQSYIYERVFAPIGDPRFASLAFALAMLALMYVLLAEMYRRRIFLKV
ncbi:MAG: heparan-alpha-glucosaminide N-acetyltransferase domain-containing protein [Vicinamibacterales bacterium]